MSAGSAAASPTCSGSNIFGEGASLQKVAQKEVLNPAYNTFCTGKGTEPKVSYEGPGSANGLNAWNFNGTTTTDTTRAFVASDDGPNATQIANAQTSANGAKVLVIPVAQTAIAVVVNPPAGCTLGVITNKQL
ncbi:MAG TPA: hypothetical protein VMT37_12410, partial [Solirubrobacterales bacterium]|nr:hypothetical protein [Solirubrobacterales bacterium]